MYRRSDRNGLTLLEVILSLFLTAVVAVLIGGLVQLYLVNETRGRENLRQTQTARAILNMIADDIRTTVRYQPYDTSGLQQMLSGAGASMMGGAGGMGGMTGGGGIGAGAPGGPSGGGGAAGNATGGGIPGGNAGGGAVPGGGGFGGVAAGGGAAGGGAAGGGAAGGGAAMGGGMGGGFSMAGGGMGAAGGASSSSTPEGTGPTVIPPGIFGTESSIEIDVSRMPRPDEYVIQPGDISRGTLGDMPSDIKTVGYYVQALRADGVLDPLAQLTAQSPQGATAANATSGGMSGGLVRRSLDRAVTQFAYLNGNSDQLGRTGEIIAPEVLGIEFSYFNASSGWQTQWDSSQMGLPHVVKVTLAMQTESKSRSSPLEPGLMLSTITSSMVEEHGIQFYSVNVIIPGSMLLSAPAPQSGTGTSSNGMSSLGL